MTFIDLPPQERGLVIAKIYHNIWYDPKRFELMMLLLKEWDECPVKEAKFLHEIHNDGENNLEKII